jgi:tetratricopeptide (TPR) repeat protein
MQKIVLIILIFFVFQQKKCFAQISKQIDSLRIVCNKLTSDSEKVEALGKLADYYYIFKLDKKADSVLNRQLLVAELSDNSNLILAALFGDAILDVGTTSTSESFDNTVKFIQKGIDYATSTKQYDFIALGYNRMSDILRMRGQFDDALRNSVHALTSLQNVISDSVKALTYVSLGDIYEARGESVDASSNYNNAYEIAVSLKSTPLQSKVHHRLAEMYKGLDDEAQARDELNKSLALNKASNYTDGLVEDYYDLARLTDEKFFIEKAIQLADSLKLYRHLLAEKRLMLTYYYVKEKDSQKALAYLRDEPDLAQNFLNGGIEKYYQALGNIYFYSDHIDSALHYFKLAEPAIEKKFDQQSRQIIFEQLASTYSLKVNYPLAIAYFLKALEISKQMNSLSDIASYSESLSGLYEKKNDFKNALLYSKQSRIYKDSLKTLSKDKDIALMKVDREKRKHEQDILQQQKLDNSRRNIQYMAITVVLIIVFFGMLLIGTFPVSKFTVRMMGYFFFISLFEFVVLLIDNLFLTHVVHNQPLKLWVIKIALIGLLAPCQHFLEKNLVGLLASRKLIEARSNISIKKWWSRMKKPSPAVDEGLEEDSAVL